ncbi:type II secretion system protein GspL [Phenylobacterium sp.]|uniref:type II secretion system protein GspL n=1 Tax=Phenylobacterium sp. TaxID=1871053 RepID=UPI0035B39E95
MRRICLVFAPQDPQRAPTYLLVDPFGDVVGRGEQPVQAGPPDPATDVVLVVPGVEVTARWLHLPTRSDAQARAAAALMLEGETALADEPLHLAVGALEEDGHRLVAAVTEPRLRGWLDLARTYGLALDHVVPDHLMVAEPEGEAPVAVRWGDLVVVRGRRLAFTCEPELAPALLDPMPPVEEGEAAERRLAAGASLAGLDLRQGAFAAADTSRPARRDLVRAGILAGVLLASPLIIDAAGTVRLNLAAGRLEQEAARTVAGILPKGAAVNDPAVQAQAALQRAQLAAGGGPAGLAARLFAALSEIDQAQAESLIVSPDGALRATVSHTNYSDVEVLRGALARAGMALREGATREEGGRIVTDVIVGARS